MSGTGQGAGRRDDARRPQDGGGTAVADRPDRSGRGGAADGREPATRSDAPSAWIVALAPVPVIVAALAMRPLVQGAQWWLSGVVFTAVLVAVMLVVRRRAPGVRFIALVATLVLGSCAAAVLNDLSPLGWLDRDGALGEALAAIRLNPAPLPQTDAIRLVVTVAIGWVAGVSLFLAAIAPTVALAAVPALVVLVVPGVITGQPASPVLVVLVGIAFLGLLWLSVRPVQRAFPAAVVGAIGLVVAVGLPVVVPLNASWLSGVTGALQSPIQPGRPAPCCSSARTCASRTSSRYCSTARRTGGRSTSSSPTWTSSAPGTGCRPSRTPAPRTPPTSSSSRSGSTRAWRTGAT